MVHFIVDVAKTLLIPLLIALAIYLISVYIVLPTYRRRQRYAHYIPVSLLPSATTSSTGVVGFVGRTRDRMLDAFGGGKWWQRRGSVASADSMFGDEELDEAVDVNVELGRGNAEGGQERRLSRDLEVGFRDDSDEEEDDERLASSRAGRARS